MPQRWFFDSFILWLIPQSRREIIWTVFFSWGAGIWRWYHIPSSFTASWTLHRDLPLSADAGGGALPPGKVCKPCRVI